MCRFCPVRGAACRTKLQSLAPSRKTALQKEMSRLNEAIARNDKNQNPIRYNCKACATGPACVRK